MRVAVVSQKKGGQKFSTFLIHYATLEKTGFLEKQKKKKTEKNRFFFDFRDTLRPALGDLFQKVDQFEYKK